MSKKETYTDVKKIICPDCKREILVYVGFDIKIDYQEHLYEEEIEDGSS